MLHDVRDLASVFFNAIGLLFKTIIIVGLFCLPAVSVVVLKQLFGYDIATLISVGVCGVVVIVGLYSLLKIWSDPDLSTSQKWDRSFGR